MIADESTGTGPALVTAVLASMYSEPPLGAAATTLVPHACFVTARSGAAEAPPPPPPPLPDVGKQALRTTFALHVETALAAASRDHGMIPRRVFKMLNSFFSSSSNRNNHRGKKQLARQQPHGKKSQAQQAAATMRTDVAASTRHDAAAAPARGAAAAADSSTPPHVESWTSWWAQHAS